MKKLILLFFVGMFFINVISADTQSLTMRFIVPSGIEFSNCRDLTGYVNENFAQSIIATSGYDVEEYWLNDTSKFDTNNNGLITNQSALTEVGTYYLRIYANDSVSNEAQCDFKITIEEKGTTLICRYKKYVIVNPHIPFMKELNCQEETFTNMNSKIPFSIGGNL